MVIAPSMVYTITIPPALNDVANLSTDCGDLTMLSGAIEMTSNSSLLGGFTCSINIAGDSYLVALTNATFMWYPSIYLPPDISHPPISVEVGKSLSPIILPQISIFVNDLISVPNIIFSASPALPPGISFFNGSIVGKPTVSGVTTVTISAVDVFSMLSTPLGDYTFNVYAPHTAVSLSKSSITAIVLSSILGMVILVLLVVLLRIRRRNSRPFDFRPIMQAADLSIFGGKEIPLEMPRTNVTILAVIGKGNFGEVSRGMIHEYRGNKDVDVAVKVLHPGPDAANARILLLEEAVVMAQFHHKNVVKLIGVVTIGNPILVVMEFCASGALDSCLKEYVLEDLNRYHIALDCAAGLAYLASRKFIHRDIAARNILLTEDFTAKIADFGMSRETKDDKDYYTSKGGQLPIRWSAPECLEERKFSEQSDVWSFGILMYEIWTNGIIPYHGWRNEKVWVQVLGGYRLPCPPGCPKAMHDIMARCWLDAGERPPFSALVIQIETFIENLDTPRRLPRRSTDFAATVRRTTLASLPTLTEVEGPPATFEAMHHYQSDSLIPVELSNDRRASIPQSLESRSSTSRLIYDIPDEELALERHAIIHTNEHHYADMVRLPARRGLASYFALGASIAR